jgi:hypothetical protein
VFSLSPSSGLTSFQIQEVQAAAQAIAHNRCSLSGSARQNPRTCRLSRPRLVAVAAAIIVLVFFDIKIEKVNTLGMEVTGLTTRVLLWTLVAILQSLQPAGV